MPELAHYFLFRFDRELGLDLRGFAPESLELLQNYSWPGNVRELQSVIKQAMLNAVGHILLPDFLPEDLRRRQPPVPAAKPEAPAFDLAALVDSLLQQGEHNLHAKVVEAAERVLFSRVLKQTHGHQTQASEILGLSRATLRTKLRHPSVWRWIGSWSMKPVTEPRRRNDPLIPFASPKRERELTSPLASG